MTTKELLALGLAATPGPWQPMNDHDWDVVIGDIDGPDDGEMHYAAVAEIIDGSPRSRANAALIVAAVNALPALCAEVEAQYAKLDGRTKSWELACENVEVERRRAEAAEAKVEALRKDAERLREALDGTVTLAEAWASYYARNYLGDISLTKEAWHATHKKIINEARAAIDAARSRNEHEG